MSCILYECLWSIQTPVRPSGGGTSKHRCSYQSLAQWHELTWLHCQCPDDRLPLRRVNTAKAETLMIKQLSKHILWTSQAKFAALLDMSPFSLVAPYKCFGETYYRSTETSGHSFWLLITRSRVRFPALPWGFPCGGRIPVVTMVWVVSRFRLKVETSSTRRQTSINSDWTYVISSLERTSSR